MKNKTIYIIVNILILVTIIIGMFAMHNNRIECEKLKYHRTFGMQSFGVMGFLTKEMRGVAGKYDNGTLTDDDLERHYYLLDEYVLSIYNQEPTEFIFNVRKFRFIKKHNAESFDNSTYENYMEIINLFNSAYFDITSGANEDDHLLMYEIYSGDEFNNQLEKILLDLQ